MKIEFTNRAAEPLTVQPQCSLGFTPAQTRAKGRDLWNPPRGKFTGTVSETASERGERAVENCGGLKRIILDFIGVFAIILELNRTLQVPTGQSDISPAHRAGNRRQ